MELERTAGTFILINRRLSFEQTGKCSGRWRQLLCSFHNYSPHSFLIRIPCPAIFLIWLPSDAELSNSLSLCHAYHIPVIVLH